MGFGSIASQIIMFIAIIILSTSLVFMYRSVIEDAANSMNEQSKQLSNKLKTDIEIVSVSYNNVTEVITAYVKNVGKTKLDVDMVDVFVDHERIYRNTQNRTITVLSDTEIQNPGIWDPNEDVEIKVFKTLNTNVTHTFQITTQYAVSDADIFS